MHMRRLLSIILVIAMLFALCMPVFADAPEPDGGTIVTTQENDGGSTQPGEPSDGNKDDDSLTQQNMDMMLLAGTEGDEVSYSTNGGSWINGTFDAAWTAANTANTTTEIKVLNNITLSEAYALRQSTAKVCIFSDTDVTITAGSTAFGFQVYDGELELGKKGASGTLTIDGGSANGFTTAAFQNNVNASSNPCTMTLNDGVVITNFSRGSTSTSYYGVFYNNGTLNIKGGKIAGNTITSTNDRDGLIFIYRTLNISGGEISNNSGGIVIMVDGQNANLVMTGGKIQKNTLGYKTRAILIAPDSGSQQAGSATITGGTITENKGEFASSDILAGKYLTSFTLDGTADIGSIALDKGKYLTIKQGFNPPSPIELFLVGSGIAVGDKFAELDSGLDVTGKFSYRNNSFTPLGNGTLGEYVTPEAQYQISGSEKWIETTLDDAVEKIGNGTGKIELLKSIETDEEITVAGTVALDLAGFTIDGGGTHRIFKVTGSLTLDDTSTAKSGTLANGMINADGYSPAGGAAIYLPTKSNATFTMNGGTLTGNKATGSMGLGGAIMAEDSTTLTINGGTISGNEAGFAGGAIGIDSAEFTMKDTVLSNNKVLKGDDFTGNYGGGAVYLQITEGAEPKNRPTISGCTFVKNSNASTASFGGGAIIVNLAELSIENCTFTENTTEYGGGAIHSYGSKVFISGSVMEKNTAKTYGGGIFISQGGQTTIADCYFEENTADSAGDDVCNTSSSASYTLSESYQDKVTGNTYKVTWYYDGAKNGNVADRYQAGVSEAKDDLLNTTERCGLKAVYSAVGNAVTIDQSITNGNVSVTGADDLTAVSAGTVLTITATPEKENGFDVYAVTEIKVTGVDGTEITVRDDNTFLMPEQDVTVSAVFARKIALQFSSNGVNSKATVGEVNEKIAKYGTISMSPTPHVEAVDTGFGFTKNQSYAYNGESYTLTAVANEGVAVKSIYLQGAYTGSKIEGTISDDGKTATLILTNEFLQTEVEKDTANIWPTINFHVAFENPQTLTVGKQKNGVTIFNIGTKDSTTEITTDSYSGNLEKEKGHQVLSDQKVYLYATGDNFKGFKLTNTQTGAVIEQTPAAIGWTTYQYNEGPKYYGFTMPNYGVTVDLLCEYSVTMSESMENGTVTASPAAADAGQEVTLTVTPTTNYELESLTVYKTGEPNVTVPVTNKKFTMPEHDVTVSAAFKQSAFAVNIAQGIQNGSISADKAEASEGETVRITAAPAENYTLKSITVTAANGEAVSVTEDTFVMPASAVTVTAVFEKSKYTVTTGALENGSVTLLEPSPIAWGEKVSFKVESDPHYEIDVVTVDGGTSQLTYDSASDTYSFDMPTKAVVISAAFKKVKYTITSQGEHVTFAIPSSDTFDWGDEVMMRLTPDEWYQIESVTAVPDVTITDNGDGTYSFIMPQSNITVTATSERPNFSVTFDSKGGTAVDAQSVANGDMIQKPAVPERVNYGFAGWYLDEGYTQKYDFSTPVTGDVKLYARWFLWGDVNGDGRVDTVDSMLIKRFAAKLIGIDKLKIPMAARVSGANKVIPDTVDSMLIKRFTAKLIDRFPVETVNRGYEFDLENNTYDAPDV